MNVALTGVSGFIGAAIARHLAEGGHRVVGLVRESSRRDHVREYVDRFVYGDHADETVWQELVEDCACVIHNSVDWEPLRDGFAQRGGLRRHFKQNLVSSLRFLELTHPRQFIFVSTIAVHHDMRPSWDPGWSGNIDEDHPLRPSSPYGAYKAAVEAHLWAERFGRDRHTSAIRPCAVYGIDPRLDRSHGYAIIRQLLEERFYERSGGGKFVHVEDVAAAAAAIVGNPDASGRPYNLVDCYARWSDWARMAADLLKIRADIVESSPPEPRNVFAKTSAASLGVPLDRGHEGIRLHLEALIGVMGSQGLLE